ncbi:MAG TPA: glycoside hydrolase family 16 protein [Verrucomicrobiota bacterium]|nr:glycoside hydrolase family 16 protein [Verrucomicrobiota bacterium]
MPRVLRCLAVLFLLAAPAARAADVPAWRLVWADEFNTGTRPDPAKWVHDLGGHGWGNDELQTYTARPENARIEHGHLVIEARQETFTGTDGRRRDYTSARLKTLGRAAWTHGRIEARIQVPRGQGLWPAFWMLGADFPTVSWPACGEIDIMENIGREPATVHGVIHGPGFSGGDGVGRSFSLTGGRRFADDFHLFAVEWETNRIRWLVNNQVFFIATPQSLPPGGQWVFHKPFFLLLNVAVGGHWPGPPNTATVFPQQMRVDYVRVYERAAAPPPVLRLDRGPDGSPEARWPEMFPQGLLETADAIGGLWQRQPVTGERRGGEFTAALRQPGIYRLRLP